MRSLYVPADGATTALRRQVPATASTLGSLPAHVIPDADDACAAWLMSCRWVGRLVVCPACGRRSRAPRCRKGMGRQAQKRHHLRVSDLNGEIRTPACRFWRVLGGPPMPSTGPDGRPRRSRPTSSTASSALHPRNSSVWRQRPGMLAPRQLRAPAWSTQRNPLRSRAWWKTRPLRPAFHPGPKTIRDRHRRARTLATGRQPGTRPQDCSRPVDRTRGRKHPRRAAGRFEAAQAPPTAPPTSAARLGGETAADPRRHHRAENRRHLGRLAPATLPVARLIAVQGLSSCRREDRCAHLRPAVKSDPPSLPPTSKAPTGA